MDELQWLAQLKPTDQVIVARGVHGDDIVDVVTHTTATQIEVGKCRYNRGDGRLRGGTSWSRARLVMPTPEHLRTIAARAAANYLSNVQWWTLPKALLLEIADLVQRTREERKGGQ